MTALQSDSSMSCSSCAQYMWVSLYAGKHVSKDKKVSGAPDTSESYVVASFDYKIIS